MTDKKAAVSAVKRLKMKKKRLKASIRNSVFIEIDYLRRLRVMREVFADDQTAFAKHINIPFKRWSNYERGYPISREMAWLLWHRLGVSVEWLWYGAEGNMKKELLDRIAAAEKSQSAEMALEQELEKKQSELDALREDRRIKLRRVEPHKS